LDVFQRLVDSRVDCPLDVVPSHLDIILHFGKVLWSNDLGKDRVNDLG